MGEKMVQTEKLYNLDLADAYGRPRHKRTNRATDMVKEYIARYSKADEVKLSNQVNTFIWSHGQNKPPRHIKLKVITQDSIANVYLPDEKIETKKEEKKQETRKEENKKEDVK